MPDTSPPSRTARPRERRPASLRAAPTSQEPFCGPRAVGASGWSGGFRSGGGSAAAEVAEAVAVALEGGAAEFSAGRVSWPGKTAATGYD
jgi:hypothetical protein